MKKSTKSSKKSYTRNYSNGKGPRCGNCKRVGHYAPTCKRAPRA